MYNEYYGLVRAPFEMTPDPSFLYLGEAHREGLATLVYAVNSGKGFVMLTGEVGTGKTTLLHALLGQLDSTTNSAFIFNPRLDPLGFFRVLFDELGIGPARESKAEYLLALNHYLIEKLAANERVLLIVDEAQNLSTEMLEEIRLLSNLETDTAKLMQIVLTGQPELIRKLSSPSLRQLRQRIAIEHHMSPLTEAQVRPYLAHRIDVAGGRYEEIFAPGVERVFFWFSQGCPRLISLLADRVLLSAYSKQLCPIPPDFVELKAKSMSATRAAGLASDLGNAH